MHCGKKDKHHGSLSPKKLKKGEDQIKPAKTTTEGTESGMIAIGKKVAMQTAPVTLNDENKAVTTRALFGT